METYTVTAAQGICNDLCDSNPLLPMSDCVPGRSMTAGVVSDVFGLVSRPTWALHEITFSKVVQIDSKVDNLLCNGATMASFSFWKKQTELLIKELQNVKAQNLELQRIIRHLRNGFNNRQVAAESILDGNLSVPCGNSVPEQKTPTLVRLAHDTHTDDGLPKFCNLQNCHWREKATALEAHLNRQGSSFTNGSSELNFSQYGALKEMHSHDEAMETLLRSELLFQMASKDIPIIISQCDQNLQYTHVKIICSTPPNYCEEDIIGQKDLELLDIIPGALEIWRVKQEVLHSGVKQRKVITLGGDGGASKWISVTCEPILDKHGAVVGIATISMDFTEKAIVRETFAQMKREIDAHVETEKGLRREIALAGEHMEAKNSFLAVMSHEIRTPLNGVLGMAQVLATTPLDGEQKDLLDAMISSGDVLLAIISDILDLSKVEAGTMVLEEKELNPRDIVKHVVRIAVAATKDRGICIEGQVDDDVPHLVVGDPLRIKQVISNLVYNAVKFTKEGRVLVRLRIFKGEEQNKGSNPSTDGVSEEEDYLNSTVQEDSSMQSSQRQCDVIENSNGSEIATGDGLILQGKLKEDWDILVKDARSDLKDLQGFNENVEVSNKGFLGEYMKNEEVRSYCVDGRDKSELRQAQRDSHVGQEAIQLKQQELEGEDGDSKSFKEQEMEAQTVWLQCEVEDTGIGIPKDAFPSLFQKFTQVHSWTTRKYGGTGLGLAICKQLVELMGGQIRVSSKIGEGSKFSFTIKCKTPVAKRITPFTRSVSQTTLDKNLSHTIAHVHKLQAGLSNVSLPPQAPGSTTPESLSEELQSSNTKIKEYGSNSLAMAVTKRPSKYTTKRDSQVGSLKVVSEDTVENFPLVSFSNKNSSLEGSSKQSTGLRRTSSGPPRIECSLMAAIKDTKEIQLPSGTSHGGKKRPRLLLAEDNKVNVMVALSMLKRLGLSADVAFDGFQALKAIQAKHYDMILMDICMPILDGLELTKRVRSFEKTGQWEEDPAASPLSSQSGAKEKSVSAFASMSEKETRLHMPGLEDCDRKRVPIVAMTANALSDCEDQCSKYGMDSFITKPITFKKLKDVLELFLIDRNRTRKVLN